jgi:hypothetical protein
MTPWCALSDPKEFRCLQCLNRCAVFTRKAQCCTFGVPVALIIVRTPPMSLGLPSAFADFCQNQRLIWTTSRCRTGAIASTSTPCRLHRLEPQKTAPASSNSSRKPVPCHKITRLKISITPDEKIRLRLARSSTAGIHPLVTGREQQWQKYLCAALRHVPWRRYQRHRAFGEQKQPAHPDLTTAAFKRRLNDYPGVIVSSVVLRPNGDLIPRTLRENGVKLPGFTWRVKDLRDLNEYMSAEISKKR